MKSNNELNLNLQSPEINTLFKTKPIIHLVTILLNWSVIFSVILINLNYSNFMVYFLSIVIIGARMHALAILTHDAAH